MKRNDSSKFPALINANNFYDRNGILIGSNTVIVDMTEQYRARVQLEKANESIRHAFNVQQEFINMAAHELRTPIQPIFLIAEFAVNETTNQKMEWGIVIKEIKRLKQIAEDILDVSRIDSGTMLYKMDDTKINEEILEVTNAGRFRLDHDGTTKKPVNIELRLDNNIISNSNQKEKDVVMQIDRSRITQALSNILNNAIMFTQRGAITIETCVLAQKKLFEIKVSDTGPGIHEDILPNLFGKFVTKNTGGEKGTGLGLYITKSIIQAHGGDIFAYNNEGGVGATFVLRLPFN